MQYLRNIPELCNFENVVAAARKKFALAEQNRSPFREENKHYFRQNRLPYLLQMGSSKCPHPVMLLNFLQCTAVLGFDSMPCKNTQHVGTFNRQNPGFSQAKSTQTEKGKSKYHELLEISKDEQCGGTILIDQKYKQVQKNHATMPERSFLNGQACHCLLGAFVLFLFMFWVNIDSSIRMSKEQGSDLISGPVDS